MKRKHTLMSILLALGMLIVFIPAMAFAQSSDTQSEASVAAVTADGATTYYDKLADAFADAAGKDAEIQILKNVSDTAFADNGRINVKAGKYVLDLNGFTVASNSQQGLAVYDANLVITDTSADKTGVLTNEFKKPGAALTLWGSTQATLDAGMVKFRGYGVYLGGSASFTLEKNGTVFSEQGTGVQIEVGANGASVFVKGGKIEAGGQNAIQNWGPNSHIEVKGGTLSAVNFPITSRTAPTEYVPENVGDKYQNTTLGTVVSITGGEFIGNNVEIQAGELYIGVEKDAPEPIFNNVQVGGKHAECNAIIEAGCFKGELLARNNGHYDIYGGKFMKALNEMDGDNAYQTGENVSRYTIYAGAFADTKDLDKRIAEDSVFTVREDGLTGVAAAEDVAATVTTKDGKDINYTDIQTAMADVKDGETLTVLNAEPGTELNTAKDILVDNQTLDTLSVNGYQLKPGEAIHTNKTEAVTKTIAEVKDMIAALNPSDADFADKVAAAREAYNALNAEQKKWVDVAYDTKLMLAEDKLKSDDQDAVLNARISLCTKIVDSLETVGKANTYKKATYTDYSTALNAAKELVNNDNATAAQLKAATNDLIVKQKALQVKTKNSLNVKGKNVKIKIKKAKKLKKAKTYKVGKVIKIKKKGQGKVTYAKASGNKKITVAKNGKVTVKKGLKKGTYKVKVKVKAAGNDNFQAVTKAVTITFKVKK